MGNLSKELQEIICNLEKMRDSQDPPSDDVLKKLDNLYCLQIALIQATINTNTEKYKKAVAAMQEAANKTKNAIDDLAKLEQAIEKAADAIGKVTELLGEVA
jgi:predicted ribosome quality control (RQC) complex YloA/Tae2 family protein